MQISYSILYKTINDINSATNILCC